MDENLIPKGSTLDEIGAENFRATVLICPNCLAPYDPRDMRKFCKNYDHGPLIAFRMKFADD